MRIDYKNLDFINSMLKELVAEGDKELHKLTGVESVITSIYRINDKGVHGQLPVRGIDLRCRIDRVGRLVEDVINSRWTYDLKRPHIKCCMYHDTGLGKHLHFQVHPNTSRKS